MTKNIINQEYSKFLADLKERVASSRYKAALSVNRELILLYHHIGMQILGAQERQGWGAKIIDQLSKDLASEFPEMKGFSVRNLKYMRKFAEEYPDNQFVQEVLAQFQGVGIATRVPQEIWNMHSGKWEVSVIPSNKSALKFWEKAISEFTSGTFNKQIKEVTYDEHCPRRIIFEFDTQNSIHQNIVPQFVVRTSQLSDIDAMVSLSKAKRMLYEKAQPQFWRYAGEAGDNTQRQWFKQLLEDKNHVMFTASACAKASVDKESDAQEILGFIIGKLMPAPEVYNQGGLTLMIDDFCVQSENLWQSVGARFMEEIKIPTQSKGAKQILVVCGSHDNPKRKFLSEQNLFIASEWFVAGIV